MRLTERQKNEVEYHRRHAEQNASILTQPFSWEVLENPLRRWWNAYWQMYACLAALDLKGKRVLVVGCGFGDDALRVAKLGADVFAFDLSPDSLAIARALAEREGLNITFEEMPAEKMRYESNFFDVIIARDILHHVDIPSAMAEIRRVAKSGALFVANEVYSHSITDRIRHSVVVERVLYPRMRHYIYGPEEPYITEDERKLNEVEIRSITEPLADVTTKKYFNFLVARVVPDRHKTFAKIDRLLLILLSPVAKFVAGRVLFAGHISK